MRARRMAKLGQRFCFDLAYPFAGDIEGLSDLIEGAGMARIKTEAKEDDFALTVCEPAEHLV